MKHIKLSFRFSSLFDGIPESIDLTDAGIAKNATPNKMADSQTGMTIIIRKPNSVLYTISSNIPLVDGITSQEETFD